MQPSTARYAHVAHRLGVVDVMSAVCGGGALGWWCGTSSLHLPYPPLHFLLLVSVSSACGPTSTVLCHACHLPPTTTTYHLPTLATLDIEAW